MAEWARVAATTIEKFNKGFEEAIKRRRILLDRAEKAGNIKYNASGLDYTWQVKMAQAQMQLNNGTQIVNFAPFNRYTRATLPYVGYVMADSITKREKLQNRGPQAMIDYLSTIIKDLYDDIHDRFSEVLYVDVNASGNGGNVSGFMTMIGSITQTYTITTKTASTPRTANAADIVGVPVATYGGISTIPGSVGGSWSGQWPIYGKGDSLYDFYSPLLVNYSSTAFDGSSTTWAANCVEATRFALTFLNRNRASEGQVDLGIGTTNMYRLFKSKLDPKERVIINQGAKDREYGISRESIAFEGAEITHEFGVPVDPTNSNDQMFFYNMDKFEILSMQDKIFKSEGPHENPTDRTDRFAVDMLGQLKFASPRFFGACLNLA